MSFDEDQDLQQEEPEEDLHSWFPTTTDLLSDCGLSIRDFI
ncbi:hypothetical protein [Paenibacillus sp. FSL L8-0709]